MKLTVKVLGMYVVGLSLMMMIASAATAQESKKPEDQPTAKKSSEQPQKGEVEGTRKRERKAARGRLPNYYTQVVDDEQREEIYSIQADYDARINELLRQAVALRNERNSKVEAVLTPDQLEQVKKITAAAKAKRKKGIAKTASSSSP